MGISHSKDHDSTKRKYSHVRFSRFQDFENFNKENIIFSRCCQISSDIENRHITNAQMCTPCYDVVRFLQT